MLSSLFAGISGLNANSNAMAVIGDNIANVNTTGFKSSRVSFANILSQSEGGFTGNEIGRGVTMSGINAQMHQGSLETTNNATDLAIHGEGFFMVKDANGAAFYTRAGEFKFDKDGNLVDPNGYTVQGWDLATGVGAGGPIANVTIPGGGSAAATATTEFSLKMNLNAGTADGETYSTSMTVHDALGNPVDLTFTFTKNGDSWDWEASVPGDPAFQTGTLDFDPATGDLTTAADVALNVPMPNGQNQAITWNLVDDTGATTGDVTGYASPSTTTFQIQDGFSSGTLQSVSVDEKGIVTGVFSNGQTKPLFQLALASFPSQWGLTKKGGNLYAESLSSGQPLIGLPGTGVLGSLISESLEMSNVDLATEFVKLITTQRAFQANSRVITASDEILTELINIKR